MARRKEIEHALGFHGELVRDSRSDVSYVPHHEVDPRIGALSESVQDIPYQFLMVRTEPG